MSPTPLHFQGQSQFIIITYIWSVPYLGKSLSRRHFNPDLTKYVVNTESVRPYDFKLDSIQYQHHNNLSSNNPLITCDSFKYLARFH